MDTELLTKYIFTEVTRELPEFQYTEPHIVEALWEKFSRLVSDTSFIEIHPKSVYFFVGWISTGKTIYREEPHESN